MSRYFALLTADGSTVANVVVADTWDGIDVTTHDPRPAPGWRYINGEFTAPPAASAPASVPDRRVTRLAFDNRFTQAERINIDLSSIDNPTGTLAARQQAASLRDMRTQVNNATFIDLDRADTRAGVQQLETSGLIGVGRAAQILDAPVQDHERPT